MAVTIEIKPDTNSDPKKISFQIWIGGVPQAQAIALDIRAETATGVTNISSGFATWFPVDAESGGAAWTYGPPNFNVATSTHKVQLLDSSLVNPHTFSDAGQYLVKVTVTSSTTITSPVMLSISNVVAAGADGGATSGTLKYADPSDPSIPLATVRSYDQGLLKLAGTPAGPQADAPPVVSNVAFSDGTTVLDRRDDKVTFTLSDVPDATQPVGTTPKFQVTALASKSEVEPFFLVASSGFVEHVLVPSDLTRSFRLVVSGYGNGTFPEILSLEAGSSKTQSLEGLIAALKLDQEYYGNKYIKDIRLSPIPSMIEIEWRTPLPPDVMKANLHSYWLAPYSSSLLGGDLQKLGYQAVATVITEGGSSSSNPSTQVSEVQRVLLPADADIKTGSVFLLDLPYSDLKTAPLTAPGATGLLSALQAALSASGNNLLTMTVVDVQGGGKALNLLWNSPGIVDGVSKLGELLPVVPTLVSGSTDQWQLSRPDIEAAFKLLDPSGYTQFGGLQIVATEGFDDDSVSDSSQPAILVFPDLQVVRSIAPDNSTSGRFSESASAQFTVILGNTVPANSLIWKIKTGTTAMGSVSQSAASADDFVSTDGQPGGSVNVPSGSLTGTFSVGITNDTLPEGSESFGIVIGHMEGGSFVTDFETSESSFILAPSDPGVVLRVGVPSVSPGGAPSLMASVLGLDQTPATPMITWTAVRANNSEVALPATSMPSVSTYGSSSGVSVSAINLVLKTEGAADAKLIRLQYDPDGAGPMTALSGELSWPPTPNGLPDVPQIMPVWEGTSTIVDRSDDAIRFDFSPSDGLSSLAAGTFKLVSRLSREEPLSVTKTASSGSNPETATFTVTTTDLAGPGFVLNAGNVWLFAGQYELEQARIAGNASSISTQTLATVLTAAAGTSSLPFTLNSAAGTLTLTWNTTGDQPDATLLKRIEFDGQTLYGPVAGATPLYSTTIKTFDQAANLGTVTHKIAVPSIATPAKYQIGIEGFGPVLLDLNSSDNADSIKTKLVTALSAVTEKPFAITASGSDLVITWSNLSASDHQPWPEGPSTFAKVEPLIPGPESKISRAALTQAIDLANYPNVFGFRAEIAESTDPDANDTPDTGTGWVDRPMPLVGHIDSSNLSLAEGGSATFNVQFNQPIPAGERSLVKWRLVHDQQDGTSNSDFTTGTNLPSVDGTLNNTFATFSADGKSATITLSIADDTTAEVRESFRIEVGSAWGSQPFVPDMDWVPTFSIEASDQTSATLSTSRVTSPTSGLQLTASGGTLSDASLKWYPITSNANSSVVTGSSPLSLTFSSDGFYSDTAIQNAIGGLSPTPIGVRALWDHDSSTTTPGIFADVIFPGSSQLPSVTISPVATAVEEGNGISFTVTLSSPLPTGVSLGWKVQPESTNGTQAADFKVTSTDTTAASSFPQGALVFTGTSATATVFTFNDSSPESAEAFRIVVSASDPGFSNTWQSTTLTINSSDQTSPSDTPATGTLGVTGEAKEGGQLTATLSNVVDVDGAPMTSYRWQQNNGTTSTPQWVDIVGATSASLSIPGDQSFVGRQVRVVAKTTDSKGGITEFFGASQTVANVNDPPGGAVTIQGVPAVGQTLTASHNITDADGIGTITYQWKANGTSINGATQPTFTLTSAEVGKTMTVTASYTDQQNTGESVTSLSTSAVTATLTTLSGKVVDGYLAGATVFADANGNFIKDAGESSTVTAADGGYTLNNPQGPITAFGGIDTSTGLPFVGGLMAPAGYTTVTPLTTLVAIYLNAKRSALGGSSFTVDQALTDIAQVTGLSKTMLTQDVYAAASTDSAALAAQKYATQLATLTQAAIALHDNSLDNGPDQLVVNGMISGLMTKISEALAVPGGAGRLQPANIDCVTAVLTAAAGTGGTAPADLGAVATAVSTLNTAIGNVSASSASPDALASILKLQAVFQSTMLSQIADDATTFSASSYDTTAELGALAATQPVRVSALPSNAIVGTLGDDSGGVRLVGTSLGEEMLGLAGDDVLLGLGGNDTLSGGPDQDALFGGDGDDRATDLAMGDIFIGGLGTDRAVFSGSATDYSVSLANSTQRSTVIGTAFAAAEFGHESGSPLYRLVSKTGATGEIFVQAEEFQFGSSNPVSPDSLIPTAPTGIVVAPSGGTHTTLAAAIAAANVGDLITVSATYAETATTPVLITKNNLRIQLDGTGAALSFKLAESAEASGVENLTLLGTRSANVTGNAANNLIVGNEGENRIDGLAGNDKIAGRGGDDDLYGGAGNDVLDGGMGWDNVFGGSGNDRLLSGEGGASSSVVGARGADLLSGGSGNDILIVATEDASAVQLLGGSGNDLYRFASIDDGRDNNGNPRNVASDPRPLQLNTFIADLTAGDGIDMAALVRGSTGTTPVGSLVSGAVQSGDLPFEFGSGKANAGLKVIGLTSASGGGTPTFSTSTGLRDDVLGSLKVALASASEVNDAISRGSDVSSSFHTTAQFESINTLLTQLSPMYQTIG